MTLERDEVIEWLTSEVGWELVSRDRYNLGVISYEFREQDSGRTYIKHSIPIDRLRWRFMIDLAFDQIKDLRQARDDIWLDYLRQKGLGVSYTSAMVQSKGEKE